MTSSEMEAPQVKADKNTIGLSVAGSEVLSKLVTDRNDLFESEAAAFKAVTALAIRLGLAPSPATGGYSTKWALSGTMKELTDFLAWYLETDAPARLAERMADAGFMHIAQKVDLNASLAEIFELSEE